ncbi:MAG: GNAT family N-acetyltransferase [Sphingomonadaceae bacterium]|nr:GNAT family N-acetyltransferase [Sphingomonadaceae bacterium]
MIETERLILRGWRDADRAPFHAMGNDPRVMAHIGPHQPRAETDAAIDRQNALLAGLGHCFWAIERRADGAFLGFCGIKPGPDGTRIAGEPEIGWRLAREYWGQGYACEAARACLDWGAANLPSDTIWSITVPGNTRSWGLMERLGMTRRADLDFDHPAVPDGSPLKRHIVYRAGRPA